MPIVINGNGLISAEGTSSTTGEIKLYEDTDFGASHVGFKAPDNVTTSVSWVLPPADGTNGQVISTDGTGTLSFVSIVGGAQGFVTQLNGGNVAPTQSADSAALI